MFHRNSQPSQTGAEDQFVWLPTASGVYSAKSGYQALKRAEDQGSQATTSLGSDFGWIRDVWAADYSPKLKVFIWSILQNALPIGTNLKNRGLPAATNCIRCGEEETVAHIFFNCPFAQNVWQEIPLTTAVHLAAQVDFKETLVASRSMICLPPTGITRNILQWVCWAIWNARNHLLFENRVFSSSETAIKGIQSSREWITAQDNAKAKQAQLPHLQAGNRQQHRVLLASYSLCKTDASWDKSSKNAGLAWIFPATESTPERRGSQRVESVSSPLMGEALAVKLALRSAVSHDLSTIRICSDNQTLIRVLNGKLFDKEIYGISQDISSISSALFVDVSFSYLPRAENSEADALAKACLRSPVVVMGR